jgi:RNA polymerase sigma-70 factor (ECF subfamily)
MTDAYLERVAAGDRSAMRACIERYSRLVWSLALRLSPSRADAEDGVQDVFLALWQSAARFDKTRSSEATFITVVARRRLIDRLRKSGRTPGNDAPPFDAERVPAADDLQMLLEANADARQAAQALAELAPDRRKVVALSVIEGMTQEEIAQTTQLPLGTVKSHLRRGLLSVRAALIGIRSTERSVAP